MGKIIALIRTSTDNQEVETQKKEVISMILNDGYKEKDIIIVGRAGASAIKLDEEYLKNINKVYELIDNGEIEAVYAWAIDRIGRNEEILMQFKNKLINKGVQLVIKNPSLKLLNSDGSTNAGVELAFTLFATMSKQEMEQKQARFKRARTRNLEQGKSIGGNAALGYDINDNKFYVINEEEAKLIKLIYNLFNTGKYSSMTLAKELNERGYKTKYGFDFTATMVLNILKNEIYTGGYIDKQGRRRNYPSIISIEEQEKAKQILATNNSRQLKSSKHYYFGLKLIKCINCGHNYQVYNGTYHCTGNILSKREGTKHLSDCQNPTSLAVNNLDGILWKLTKDFMKEEIESDNSQMEKDTKEKMSILHSKKDVLERKLSLYDKKIEDIVERADKELRSEEYISKRIATVNKQREIENKELIRIKDELKRLENNLNFNSFFQKIYMSYNSISDVELRGNEKEMYELVHRYIKNITFEKCVFENNPFYYKINIETHKGGVVIYYNGHDRYLRRCYIEYENDLYYDDGIYPFLFERLIRTEQGITSKSNEKFRQFHNIIEQKHFNHTSDLWDWLNGEGEELFTSVINDNSQRVIQYINQLSERIKS